MTGWAFILMVWLAGADRPQVDASLWLNDDLTKCQEAERKFRHLYEVGEPHPVLGETVTGFKTFCLRMPKPAEGRET